VNPPSLHFCRCPNTHPIGHIVTGPGGIPLRNSKGEVVGAIGGGGSTVENDHTVAAAGAAALGK